MTKNTKTKLHGKTLSPGMGKGKAFVYRDVLTRHDEFYDIDEAQVDKELARFEVALKHITGVLDDLVEHCGGGDGFQLGRYLPGAFNDCAGYQFAIRGREKRSVRNGSVPVRQSERCSGDGSGGSNPWKPKWPGRRAMTFATWRGGWSSSLAGIRKPCVGRHPARLRSGGQPHPALRHHFSGPEQGRSCRAGNGWCNFPRRLVCHEIGLPCIAGLEGMLENIMPGELVLVDADVAEAIVNPEREDEAALTENRSSATRAMPKL